MPPKCCSFLQIHTVVNHLSTKEAMQYREKFEEWISPTKTYCPAKTCSAFIPERLIPRLPSEEEKKTSRLSKFLQNILASVQQSPSARFFRGEMDITQLPGYNNVVKNPIDLGKINANIPRYDSVNSLTLDMQLLAKNAREYNGAEHPVSKAAEKLFRDYTQTLSLQTQQLLDQPNKGDDTNPTFTCPKCRIGICAACKTLAHGERPCDTTVSDKELTMLETFGYKRCPRCKTGVKKMYGCSHMQCICGAHWCWSCQKSIDECGGECSPEDDEEEDYYSEEDLEEGEVDERPPRPAPAAAANNPDAPQNLDRPGERWAEGNFDFGDEPEEDGRAQVWSCTHHFHPYSIKKEDEFDCGDYLSMECNRCFKKVMPRKPSMSWRTLKIRMGEAGRSSSFGKFVRFVEKNGEGRDGVGVARECCRCRLVVCVECEGKYEAE